MHKIWGWQVYTLEEDVEMFDGILMEFSLNFLLLLLRNILGLIQISCQVNFAFVKVLNNLTMLFSVYFKV